MALSAPHTRHLLPDDPSGQYQRSELWSVLIFHLLTPQQATDIVALTEQHAASCGWSTQRHKHYPTTDIAVRPETASSLHAVLSPIVNEIILPTIGQHYNFSSEEMRMRDLFVVKYECGAPGVQNRLAPHRDGNLLSFSILLSDPSSFDGGGLRFHSLGPRCDVCCKSGPVIDASCARCQGVGRLAITGVGRGDLTMHCGKLLHEGAPVTRGTRYVVVGFVNIESPRVDSLFVNFSKLANYAASGRQADHEVVGRALVPLGNGSLSTAASLGLATAVDLSDPAGATTARCKTQAEREVDDLAGQGFF